MSNETNIARVQLIDVEPCVIRAEAWPGFMPRLNLRIFSADGQTAAAALDDKAMLALREAITHALGDAP